MTPLTLSCPRKRDMGCCWEKGFVCGKLSQASGRFETKYITALFFFVSGLITPQSHSTSPHTRAHCMHVHTQLSVSLFWWEWRAGTLMDKCWVSGWKADNYIFNRIFKGQTYKSVIGIFTGQLKRRSSSKKKRKRRWRSLERMGET